MKIFSINEPNEDIMNIKIREGLQIIYPCIILAKDRFNDFNFTTTFRVYFFETNVKYNYIGQVKIMYVSDRDTVLPAQIHQLDNNYKSLGQTLEFYHRLRHFLNGQASHDFLKAINDITIDKSTIRNYEALDVFRKSLVRFSEAKKLYLSSKQIKTEIPSIFCFESTVVGANNPHKVVFNFTENKFLPFRIHVLIGKNGTGKTQFMSNLAGILSGLKENGSCGTFTIPDKNHGAFIPTTPEFQKIIAIAYSPFDNFIKTNTFSYIYCGLRDNEERIDIDRIWNRIRIEYKDIQKRSFESIYLESITEILNFDDNDFRDQFIEFLNDPSNHNLQKKLSSGQIQIISMLSNILSNIAPQSLLLFDEFDLYLHPNAISRAIKVINRLLDRFHSFAIISTHSVFIIQHIPSTHISVFERNVNFENVRTLGVECFGANIASIANDIFMQIENEKFYMEYLNKIADNLDLENALKLFNRKLSFGAGMILQSLYLAKEEKRNNDKINTD